MSKTQVSKRPFSPTPFIDSLSTSSSVEIEPSGSIDLKPILSKLSEEEKNEQALILKYRRLVDYLATAQIYLKDNCLMTEPLKKEHIKPRLLGHFGTCPGISVVYIHCNRLIVKHNLDMFIVVGPGHGAPAVLANLFVSGELGEFYSQYNNSSEGVAQLIKDFSREGGFPSHVNPQTPGAIHEGGELGYALAVSYGAVMDNPDLIVTCIVGDGESETGPTATAWHSHKYIDPVDSGAVIPILNLNGFKISSTTIYGTMSDEDLIKLFNGYGYTARIVGHDVDHIDIDMSLAMEWAYQLIRKIQNAARSGKPIFKPHWPMIILRIPKGLGTIKELHGKKVEGTYLSHQVPAKEPQSDEEEFKKLDQWLRSYKIEELIDLKTGIIHQELIDLCPKGRMRMGWNKHTNPDFHPLSLPNIKDFETKLDLSFRGSTKDQTSPTLRCGEYLSAVIEKNPGRFRIFSPDELESNKLNAVLKVTNRCYQWHENMANRGGYVIEMLSEHTMQGFMQGYALTGRYGLFPSYEAFLGIITTMVIQYAKFQKLCFQLKWKHDNPAITYIESSTLWRQEHNGFSHQNPGFLNSLVNLKSSIVRIYLPPDTNCLISTMNHCLGSKNNVNLIISSKNENNNWLSMDDAVEHCRAGVSIWRWAGNESMDGRDPDIILVSSGNEVTTEIIAAAQILIKLFPNIITRVVNITDLMILEGDSEHPHGLSDELFNGLFPPNKPVIYNFHGYPSVVKQLVFSRKNSHDWLILGYQEEGTTTTPFNMQIVNETSRFHIAMLAIKKLSVDHKSVAEEAAVKIANIKHDLRLVKEYITETNTDPKELFDFRITANKPVE